MVVIWAIPICNGHCAGTHCSVQPKNSILHVQGSLNLTFAHTGKFGQILCYTCDVVRMVHEHMLQLVLARGLSGRDMGNTNLKSALCGHVLFGSTWK